MTEGKAEWERALDESWQWHVGHRIAMVMHFVIVALAVVLWDLRVLGCCIISSVLYFGCVAKENLMIRRARQLRREGR